ncbi:MAG: hypothetical protein EBR82_24805 [Caulobacteraceae bacterium]|nr:hypothetical protein [Caulobacteraceae bacterium]
MLFLRSQEHLYLSKLILLPLHLHIFLMFPCVLFMECVEFCRMVIRQQDLSRWFLHNLQESVYKKMIVHSFFIIQPPDNIRTALFLEMRI